MGLDCLVFSVPKDNTVINIDNELYYWRKNWEIFHFFQKEFERYSDKKHSFEMFKQICPRYKGISYDEFIKLSDDYCDIPTEVTKETIERLKKEVTSFDVNYTLFDSKRAMNKDFKQFEKAVNESLNNGNRLYFIGDY